MREQGKRLLWSGILLMGLFVLWTGLIQTVDVQSIGPAGTRVGFAALNGWFHRLTGVHMGLYTVTDWLGLVPVFVCLLFALIGFVQMLRRRSLLKVDRDLILLGVYYALVILGYLIFEVVPLNYRPILIEGRLEASYPSSTTLLVLSVMPTLALQAHRRLRGRKAKCAVNLFVTVFSTCMVAGRLISGVHWLTDIVGGVLLSAGLFCIYRAAVV